MENKIIIIGGATATGKTSLGIQLAHFLKKEIKKNVHIINFDSMLFYNELNIGTAKPTQSELSEIPHHMINVRKLNEGPMDAFQYVELTLPIIEQLQKKDTIILLVGGSGFYLRALLKGMYSNAPTNEELKKELEKLYKHKGIEPFINYLKEHDPLSLTQLHQNDHYRLTRAVEFHRLSGEKISSLKNDKELNNHYDFTNLQNENWKIINFYFNIPKSFHWDLIKKRTEEIISNGLIEEVKTILNTHTGNERPLQSIGYKEAMAFLNGEIKSIEECIEKIYFSTRQLAKSQKTFFKKITPKIEINPLSQKEEFLKTCLEFIKKDEQGLEN